MHCREPELDNSISHPSLKDCCEEGHLFLSEILKAPRSGHPVGLSRTLESWEEDEREYKQYSSCQ